jgi:hypothetical protein
VHDYARPTTSEEENVEVEWCGHGRTRNLCPYGLVESQTATNTHVILGAPRVALAASTSDSDCLLCSNSHSGYTRHLTWLHPQEHLYIMLAAFRCKYVLHLCMYTSC